MLKRFSQLNRDFQELQAAYQSTESLSAKLRTVEEERDAQVAKFNTLMKEFRVLEDDEIAASNREKGLTDRIYAA